MGEALPPLRLCDLPCCGTHSLNSCYSDPIAWLCEGLRGRVVDPTGPLSFLHRPEASHRAQLGVAHPCPSVPGSLALWLLPRQAHEVVEGRGPSGRPSGRGEEKATPAR